MGIVIVTMENSMEITQKTKSELPYDPATPFLVIYPQKIIIQKNICTPISIAAVFTRAKTWKQSARPSIRGWIKKMQFLDTTEYYSTVKKNKFCH